MNAINDSSSTPAPSLPQKHIVAMLTCHNRKNLTLACLSKLRQQRLPSGFSLSFVVVDDGSKDGTADAVLEAFPNATVVRGDGSLYWCGGMRVAWQKAAEFDPDFYLAVNDDTMLDDHALEALLEAMSASPKPSLAVGAIRCHESSQTIYGGIHGRRRVMAPTGKPELCVTCNGNCLLIPREAYLKLGVFHHSYTHNMGDFDYGYQATKHGFPVYQTSVHVGACSLNSPRNTWEDRNLRRIERLRLLQTPKGLPWREWCEFNFRNSGWRAAYLCINPFLRILLNL